MVKKCPRIPKEVRNGFKAGAEEVTIKNPKYKQDIKIIKREGKEVYIKYRKKDIPEECWNN